MILFIFYLEWWFVTRSYIPDMNFALIYLIGTILNVLLFTFVIYKPKSVTINNESISFKDSKSETTLTWSADIKAARFKKIGSRWIFLTNYKPIIYGFDGLNKKDINLLNSLIHDNLKTNGFEPKGKLAVTYTK